MGVYVEITCDWNTALDDIGRPACQDAMGDQPQGHTVSAARAAAKRQGWRVGPDRAAVCPSCLKSGPPNRTLSHGEKT